MGQKIRIESKQLLAVEGKDEYNFFGALLNHQNISKIQIIDIGGKDKFKTELPNIVNLEGFSDVHTLGFIRDAEENQAESAFSSICAVLKRNNLPAPTNINTMIDEQNIRIGVFIMPNNIDKGMLEDLCLESVKTNPVFQCVDQYISCCLLCLSENESNINRSKAKIQTYLAIKNPIVNSLGLAAQKGHWNFEDDCFSDIKKFLHTLFSKSEE
jgi:hypothetical protein